MLPFVRRPCGLPFCLLGVLFLGMAGCWPSAPAANSPPSLPAQGNATQKSPPQENVGEGQGTPGEVAAEKQEPAANNTEEDNAAPAGNPASAEPPRTEVLADEVPETIYEPRVVLSEAHAKTSLVKVGDTFPELAATDLAGAEVKVPAVAGTGLTVVVFWSSRQAYAREQFLRLNSEVAQRYAARGVQVVAVNVGDTAEVVRPLYAQAGGAFPCLLDTGGKALALVATGEPPRVYLLDGQRKVLWFDLEYSRSTRRELHNAVHFHTQGAVAAALK